MTGLVLEGGGTKGSYEAGAYIAFLKCGIKIDGVVGTSIGAINAAFIASGRGHELPKIWRSINISSLIGLSDDYHEELKKGITFSLIKKSFKNIISAIENKGLELNNLREFLEKELDIEKLYKSPIDFGLVTVKRKGLEPLYLFKEDMLKEKMIDYILASSYLPIFKKEKLIDDNFYLDGGFYDNGPVNMLYKKGYDKIFLIKADGIGITKKFDPSKVTIIKPSRYVGLTIELNSNIVNENIRMGYFDTMRVLKKLDGNIYTFKKRSVSYYKRINRNISAPEYRRVKNFFGTNTYKDTTIKALEYIMKKEEYNYYKIYNAYKEIKYIRKKCQKEHFIYEYISNLKF